MPGARNIVFKQIKVFNRLIKQVFVTNSNNKSLLGNSLLYKFSEEGDGSIQKSSLCFRWRGR